MLVVRLELHPRGDAKRVREIGRIEISNVSELAPVSDYQFNVTFVRRVGDGEVREIGYGRVSGHRRDDGAWKLVQRVIEQIVPKVHP
jgi:hypothetical protein